MQFNEQQLKAINHFEGPCAVIAGAGSGKSTVLVKRIETLIQKGVAEYEIMAISFTKATAEDLKKKLNAKGILNVNVGTFHSILGRMLYQNGINVYNTVPPFEVQKAFNKIQYGAEIDDILSFISYQKCFMKSYNDVFVAKESAYTNTELSLYFEEYEKLKRSKNAYDFDDWLIKAYELLCSRPGIIRPKYLLVDEHQDSNMVQNKLIEQLCPSRNIFVVGDYRQSIYGFRGAVPKYFMNFSKIYPDATIINLDYNYRSAKQIVERSNKFMKQYYGNYEHYSDSISTSDKNGEITFEWYEDEFDMAEDIANHIGNLTTFMDVEPKDIAILFRNNAQAAEMEMSLMKRKIPYDLESDGNFFASKQILPIVSMLRLLKNREDDEAYANIVKTRCMPFTFLSKQSFIEVERMAALQNISYVNASMMVPVNSNQQNMLATFTQKLNFLENQVRIGTNLIELIENIIVTLDLRSFVGQKFHSSEEKEARLKSFETLKMFAKTYTLDGFLKFLASGSTGNNKKKNENSIKMMTIHKSKGLEFKHVFVIGLKENTFPSEKADITEEARLFYVAVTRPIEALHLRQIGQTNCFVQQYFKKEGTK